MNIKDYWIEELKDIKEFQAIDGAENPEIKEFNTIIQNLIDDQFIQTATDKGLARREKLLNIFPFADDTTESRRFRLLTRWNEQLPYTYTVLIDKLNQLCGENGYSVVLNTGQYTLDIKIELTQKRMFNEVSLLSRKMVPANISITVELRYNQYSKLASFTHNELKAFTHTQIREEEL